MEKYLFFILMTALFVTTSMSCDQVVRTGEDTTGLIAINLIVDIRSAHTYVSNDQWETADVPF